MYGVCSQALSTCLTLALGPDFEHAGHDFAQLFNIRCVRAEAVVAKYQLSVLFGVESRVEGCQF